MMNYYQELTILPAYDIPASFIWSKIYQQIHLAFASRKDQNGNIKIGVSFPEYKIDKDKKNLGNKLRIFAESEEELRQLDLGRVLERFDDYIHLTRPRQVPDMLKGYAVYRRFHQENSQVQKARRFAKRNDLSYEKARLLFAKKQNDCKFPYLQLKSLTNQHSFSLFIQKLEVKNSVYEGFGTYGLSSISTVPEF